MIRTRTLTSDEVASVKTTLAHEWGYAHKGEIVIWRQRAWKVYDADADYEVRHKRYDRATLVLFDGIDQLAWGINPNDVV